MAERVDFFEKKCEFRAPMAPFGGEGRIGREIAFRRAISGR
jgi:hypothetical protein